MTTGQRALFSPDLHGEIDTVGDAGFVAGKSVIVQNCWNPGDWHIVTRNDRTRTRRGCWTLVEAMFYIASPLRFRHLAAAGERA